MVALQEPPNDMAAEMAVIASMILDASTIGQITEIITSQDFYTKEARLFYEAIVELWLARPKDAEPGEGLDAILVRDNIARKGLWSKQMHNLMLQSLNTLPSAANGPYYAKIVKEKANERNLICSVTRIASTIEDSSVTLEEKQKMLYEASMQMGNFQQNPVVSMRDIADSILDNAQNNAMGLRTGFEALDDAMMGLAPGEFIIIAGRPSMGKTSLALNMALNQALAGHHVGVFSLEMNTQSLSERLLTMLVRIPLKPIKMGYISPEQREQVKAAISQLKDMEIHIDSTAGLNATQLATKVKLMQAQFGIDVVYIDYLQLMGGGRSNDRQQEITEISRSIMSIAKSANIPIVVASQLNRALEYRSDHRPKLSDLRESGSLEQDAHKVLLLHREDYYREREEPGATMDGLAQCIIAKNRQGPLEDVKLLWEPEFFQFTDYQESGQLVL